MNVKDSTRSNESSGVPGGEGAVIAPFVTATMSSRPDFDRPGSDPRQNGPTDPTRGLIDIWATLRSIDQNDPLKLPSIVVIGGQGAWKSSVLEVVVGYMFLSE